VAKKENAKVIEEMRHVHFWSQLCKIKKTVYSLQTSFTLIGNIPEHIIQTELNYYDKGS
jgi:hypothetical protein